jgi:hypothetical protein
MQAEERSHHLVEQILNACVLTIGLYIATIPVAPSTPDRTTRSPDAVKQLGKMAQPAQKPAEQSNHRATHQATFNRTSVQAILQTLNTVLFNKSS